MKKLLSVITIVLISAMVHASIRPVKLTCENLNNPPVVDIQKPRLSWINVAEENKRGQYQTAWEIQVSGTKENLLKGKAELWNSGKVNSPESVNIPYNGSVLSSRQDCWWRVRVWDRKGKRSGWSEPAFWSMGLLSQDEWQAKWIGAPWQGEEPLTRPKFPAGKSGNRHPGDTNTPPPAPMLRKKITIDKDIASARAFVTGLGFFEFYVNGVKAGNDVMSPNVTLYGKRDDLGPIGVMIRNNFREYRVMYLSYDIGNLLHKGENVLGTMLGNGFYNPGYYWTQGYGTPRFLGQIYITYTDGSELVITSDQTWKAAESPVVMDLVYDGEHYDARLEQPGWCKPGFDDSGWENAILRKAPEGSMKAQMSPPDRVMESLAPRKIEKLANGHYKVDFGQEISGWIHIMNVTGERGNRIEIRYICESPVGDNTYTMKGGGPESYSARFTWFVFREAEIINWPGDLTPDQVRAEAVYSYVIKTGHFSCSNNLFNSINKIWQRSQTDNMHGGIASDCPHRERSPYTGDGQVSCVTVMNNFDARTFYTKWIQDIFGAQNPDNGYVPNGAPWQPGCGGGVAWGAAMNIMPWEYYLHYGDLELLRNNFEGMKGYVRYMLTWTDKEGIMFSQAPDRSYPNRWINLGDWVAPGKMPPDEMVHTFYLWRCSKLTAMAARALGQTQDEAEYNALAEKTRKAFMKKFYDASQGTYGPYGGNIFALKMGVPEDEKKSVLNALESDIHSHDDHLDTGIFGTQFFFEVLSENGLNNLAYNVMNQRTMPSYGWWLDQGATTTWEQWNGNGSRNHPMFGGGISWFYTYVAGMNPDPDQPGYKHIILKPVPPEDLKSASYSNLTPYGTAGIDWEKENNSISVNIKVPVGCSATVWVPASSENSVKENGKSISRKGIIIFAGMIDGYAIYEVKSGNYHFVSTTGIR
jgi:alpha-L-rhamnosidase